MIDPTLKVFIFVSLVFILGRCVVPPILILGIYNDVGVIIRNRNRQQTPAVMDGS